MKRLLLVMGGGGGAPKSRRGLTGTLALVIVITHVAVPKVVGKNQQDVRLVGSKY